MGPQLQHSDWLTGRVPDEVRAQIRRLVEVLGYLPHLQPLGVVTADAVLRAADWADVMPGWEERVRGWDEGASRSRAPTRSRSTWCGPAAWSSGRTWWRRRW